MKKHLIQCLTLTCGVAMAAGAPPPAPTATELLVNFAATQEPLKSFVAAYEMTAQTDFPNAAPPIRGSSSSLGEVRVDFPLVAERSRNWGAFGGTKAQPRYSSRISDGHLGLLYDQQSDAGSAMVMPQSQPRTGITCAAEAIGRSWGLHECFGVLLAGGELRFDRKIRHEATLRVRDRLEPAGWTPTPCYVLEAKTQTGDYTVWLDPSRGYTLARALVERHYGHLRPNGRPYAKGESNVNTVEKIRWEQQQGVWVPVEATGGQSGTNPGKAADRQSWHFSLTRFVLNPDHTALRSFMPDDIRDGAKFTLVGEDRRTKGEGTWQKGRAVDAVGNVFWTPESLIEDQAPSGRAGAAATGWSATNPVPLTATQVLDEFARTQDRLLSLAYTATTTEEVKAGNRFYVAEVRTATNRAASRECGWGPGMSTPTSRADPYNYIVVSDGNIRCRYSAQGKRPGTLSIYPAGVKPDPPDSARRAILNYNNAGYLFGLFGGAEDRCDIILRNASELHMRNQPEPVNGIACLVLEARCTRGETDGQYALWFDPAHDYHIARAEIRLGPKGASPAAIFRINQVGFHQVDGVWVPTSAEADSWQRNTRDGSTSSSKIHVRITAVRVNPKDKPVNAFGLDDVRDGSRVMLFDSGFINGVNKWQIKGQGTWQKGRAVDGVGNVFWTPESLGGMGTNWPPRNGQTGGSDEPNSGGKK